MRSGVRGCDGAKAGRKREPIRGEVPFSGAHGRWTYDYIFVPVRDSRERLQAALEGSGAGTFRWDIQTNVLEWDVNLDRLFGLTAGQTVRSLEKFIATVHPEDRQTVTDCCRRCAEDGTDFEMEFRVVWPDGTMIRLSVNCRGDEVEVMLSDTGIGIPAANVRTIFEMFSQVEESLSRSQGGLGIGLCLVSRLVEMHGGIIEARSEGPGQGSDFIVRLGNETRSTQSVNFCAAERGPGAKDTFCVSHSRVVA